MLAGFILPASAEDSGSASRRLGKTGARWIGQKPENQPAVARFAAPNLANRQHGGRTSSGRLKWRLPSSLSGPSSTRPEWTRASRKAPAQFRPLIRKVANLQPVDPFDDPFGDDRPQRDPAAESADQSKLAVKAAVPTDERELQPDEFAIELPEPEADEPATKEEQRKLAAEDCADTLADLKRKPLSAIELNISPPKKHRAKEINWDGGEIYDESLGEVVSIDYDAGAEKEITITFAGGERHYDRVLLDVHDFEEFQETWKEGWTKLGKDAPFCRYARPVFYSNGTVELEAIGGETFDVALADLTEEDQEFFRRAWRFPLEDRVWTDRAGSRQIVGKLYDLRHGYAYIHTTQGSIERIAVRQLSEADFWYATDGWEVPNTCRFVGETFEPRQWVESTYTWTASALCHKPLYFEEEQLERYGHSAGPYVQPIVSGAHFFATIPLLPYKMGINPPDECQYALGYYRPGNCAPYLVSPFPLSVRGGLIQAGVATGLVFLIP